MCLQRINTRLRNVDPQRDRQKETADVQDEMLSTDSKNSPEGHDPKRRYSTEDHSRHDQGKDIMIIWSHLQNGRHHGMG